MGCCGSKEYQDEDDVNAPLLNNDTGENQMNYHTYETIDAQKEQEFWDSIIDRTTQNLIDISSAQTEPLQGTDVEERENKYRHLLERIQPKQHIQPQLSVVTGSNNNTVDVLSNAKPNAGMSDGEVDWLYQTMDEIQDALQRIEIEPVGDMVVHLTMSDSSTIKAY